MTAASLAAARDALEAAFEDGIPWWTTPGFLAMGHAQLRLAAALGLALALHAAAGAAGLAMLRWAGVRGPGRAAALATLPAGWVAAGSVLLGLGWGGLLHPAVLVPVSLVALRRGRPSRRWRAAWREAAWPAVPADQGAPLRWARRVAATGLAVTAVLLLAPETHPRALADHLARAGRFAALHRVAVPEDADVGALGTALLRAWSLALGSEPAARLWSLGALLVSGAAIRAAVAARVGSAAGWVAGALWVGGPEATWLARESEPLLFELAAAGTVVAWVFRRRVAAARAAGRWTAVAAGGLLAVQAARMGVGSAADGALLAGLGLESPEAFVSRRLGGWADLTDRLGRRLPSGARVMVAGDRRRWPAPRALVTADPGKPLAVADLVRASADAAGLARRWRQRGITHVVHNPALAWMDDVHAVDWPAREAGVWAAFWRRHARLVEAPDRIDPREGGWYLYDVRLSGGPRPVLTLPGAEHLGGLEPAALGRLAGDVPEVAARLALREAAVRPATAIAALEGAEAAGYRDPVCQTALAALYEARGDLTRALAVCERIARNGAEIERGRHLRILRALAKAARARRDAAAAERYLRAGLELDPRNAPFWAELAEILVWQGRRGEAMDAMERAILWDPAHRGYRGTLGHMMRAS